MSPERAKPSKTDEDTILAMEVQKRQLDDIERRKVSPQGLEAAMFHTEDPYEEHMRIHCPECLDKKDAHGNVIERAEVRMFVDEPGENDVTHKRNVAKGWMPLKNSSGEIVRFGACYTYTRPRVISDAIINKAADLDKIRLSSLDSEMGAAQKESKEAFGESLVEEEVVVSRPE